MTVRVIQRGNGRARTFFSAGGYQLYLRLLSTSANGPVAADAIYVVKDHVASTASLVWSASLPASGDYDVYARWPADSSRSAAAQYDIDYDGGSATVTLDQRA